MPKMLRIASSCELLGAAKSALHSAGQSRYGASAGRAGRSHLWHHCGSHKDPKIPAKIPVSLVNRTRGKASLEAWCSTWARGEQSQLEPPTPFIGTLKTKKVRSSTYGRDIVDFPDVFARIAGVSRPDPVRLRSSHLRQRVIFK